MSQPSNKPQQRPARPREPKAQPMSPEQARRELGFGMLQEQKR